ncbi:MAG TPA: ArdC family protein [Vicinamibacterales bacterium]|nr:ArdC family protein [Vicinamibacterales bacterium]
MTTDELKTLTASALDTLAMALDHGHSERLIEMFRAMSRFHQYSWHNVCLIAAQHPTATRVAGFQTWKSLGRFVRRGEKGIAITAPIVRRTTSADGDDSRAIVGFRAAYVFDIAQTDGDPLPEVADAAGDPGDAVTRLRDTITGSGIQVTYVDDLHGALGLSKGRAIEILSGLTPANEFTVLVHEYAHLCTEVSYVRSAGGRCS